MADIAAFHKILRMKKEEKRKADQAYKHSVTEFEETASLLYKLLKKKEETEKNSDCFSSSVTTITSLQRRSAYIAKLVKEIITLQEMVNKKRKEMDDRQNILSGTYIEVKKYEKLVENKLMEAKEREKLAEYKWLDEIAVTQYVNSRNGG